MKFETLQNRMKHRLKLVNQMAKNGKDICKVMPILAFDTFRAVLQEIMIPLAVCDFEAGKEIGLLANKLNCPVLSYDSDFYILPLTGGFIHFYNQIKGSEFKRQKKHFKCVQNYYRKIYFQ